MNSPEDLRLRGKYTAVIFRLKPAIMPSLIRTIPSASEFHRIMRILRSRAVPPVGIWVINPHPAPKADLFLNSHYTRVDVPINEGYNAYL